MKLHSHNGSIEVTDLVGTHPRIEARTLRFSIDAFGLDPPTFEPRCSSRCSALMALTAWVRDARAAGLDHEDIEALFESVVLDSFRLREDTA